MSDLKPCPACGGRGRTLTRVDAPDTWVECGGRMCIATRIHPTEAEAIAIWNSLPRRDDPRDVAMDMMDQAIERKRMRFEAAMAALQGLNANAQLTPYKAEALAMFAVEAADLLLAELAKEKP